MADYKGIFFVCFGSQAFTPDFDNTKGLTELEGPL